MNGNRIPDRSSAAIKYLNRTLPQKGFSSIDDFINKDRTISFITEIELQAWNPVNPDDMIHYKRFVEQSTIISVTTDIIAETIAIRRDYRLRITDAIPSVHQSENNVDSQTDSAR